jgi:hypothetical protein
VLVDWPRAARGAPWVDTVLFALDAAAHGGVDPEILVGATLLAAAADPAAVTDLLLGSTGMWGGDAAVTAPGSADSARVPAAVPRRGAGPGRRRAESVGGHG